MRDIAASCPASKPARSLRFGVAIQSALVLATGLLAFAPPAQGLMLLVPVSPAAAAQLDDLVETSGATRIGLGPLPGSYYVEGARARLFPAALARGILLFSGRARLCGPASEASQS